MPRRLQPDPQAQPAFRGALGTLDRPYAAPGDFIDVNVRQALCDGPRPASRFDPDTSRGDAALHADAARSARRADDRAVREPRDAARRLRGDAPAIAKAA
jgi:hypothetical protein